MFCGQQWQLQPRQRGHFTAPQPGGINHPVGVNVAFGRFHYPCAIRLLHRGRDRREPVDFCPSLPRAHSIGVGHTRRVHITAIRLEHDTTDAVEIDQRMQPFGLIPRHFVEIHAVKLRLGFLQTQLVFAVLGLSKVERAGFEYTAGLASFGLQFFVERHRVMLQAGDIGAVMQPVDIGRRMPSAARCQFITFQQDHIGPAQFREVIED